MLQASPHVIHFKSILDFGDGQGYENTVVERRSSGRMVGKPSGLWKVRL